MDLRCDAHHTALTISDCGPGIEPELAARLFQPFSAGDVRSGSGLAWAICQEIVQALGGSITLTNREQGTRIRGWTPWFACRLRSTLPAPPMATRHN